MLGLTWFVWGLHSNRLGFYSDDAGFLTTLPGLGLSGTIAEAGDYVPGRNLHIIWQQLIFLVAGSGPDSLPTQHLIQSLLDGATVALFYLVTRQLGLPALWAVLASAVFAFYPTHGETHFWLSSGPMNVMSTLLFLVYSLLAVRAARAIKRGGRSGSAMLALELAFFILALYTYDQTFFVLCLVLGLRTLHLLWLRVRFTTPLVVAGAGYLLAVAFYLQLKRDPASGPTLTYLDRDHILSNVSLSLSVTLGKLYDTSLDALLARATEGDREIAWSIALACLLLAVLVLFYERRRGLGQGTGGVLRHLALGALACAFFFLAYLPVYLWYISPRHNFLPTIGLALLIGSLGAAATVQLRRYVHPHAADGVNVAVAVLAAVLLVDPITGGLAEKRFWADAYQLRRVLYERLIQENRLEGKTAIVFDSFPASLGPVPFFAQENHLGLNYLYGERSALDASSLGAIETEAGYFLYTELDRYGGISVQYRPKRLVERLVYRSHSGWTIDFAKENPHYRISRFYQVNLSRSRSFGAGMPVAGEPFIRSASFERTRGRSPTLTVDVNADSLRASPTTVVGLVLTTRRGGADVPLHTLSATGERMVVPILLLGGGASPDASRANRFVITLKDPAVLGVSKLALYRFAARPPLLLEERSLSGGES